MNLPLDPASEQIIQREVERGHYATPADVVVNALSMLEDREDWLLRNKEALNLRLAESMAQAARGETYTAEEVARLLDERIDPRAQ